MNETETMKIEIEQLTKQRSDIESQITIVEGDYKSTQQTLVESFSETVMQKASTLAARLTALRDALSGLMQRLTTKQAIYEKTEAIRQEKAREQRLADSANEKKAIQDKAIEYVFAQSEALQKVYENLDENMLKVFNDIITDRQRDGVARQPSDSLFQTLNASNKHPLTENFLTGFQFYLNQKERKARKAQSA